jgi:radical SAM protein with 4Fe4S-binding SPASM domain
MSNIFYRWPDLQRLKNGEMILPNFVDVHLSDICNQSCRGCAFKAGHENEMMSESDFMFAAKILMDNGVQGLAFCGGGEPCTLPYLPQVWEYIRSRDCHFAMLTNGSLLTPQIMGAMLYSGTFIRVSLETSNREDYCAYKQVPDDVWDRVINNVRVLVKLKKLNNSQCSVGIKFAVSKSLRGKNHFEDGVQLAKELGVDRVTFKAIRGGEEELEYAESVVEDALLDDALKQLQPSCIVARWITPVKTIFIPQCWLNPLHTVMNWKGDLFICCYYYFRKERHKIGNIFEQDFKEMWFSDKHKELIKNIKREECAKVDCKFFHYHDEFNETDKVGSLYLI